VGGEMPEDLEAAFSDKGKHSREMQDKAAGISAMKDKDESIERVKNVIKSLKPEYQEIIELKDLQRKKLQDIGEMLGLSLPAVKSRLKRARTELSERLAQNAPNTEAA
jgi:RNA polymerase sigma-70 factor (ECF subfamily)